MTFTFPLRATVLASAALLLPGWRAIAMPALLAVTSGAALYAAGHSGVLDLGRVLPDVADDVGALARRQLDDARAVEHDVSLADRRGVGPVTLR